MEEIENVDEKALKENSENVIQENNENQTDFQEIEIQSPPPSRSDSLNGQTVVGSRLSIPSFKGFSLSSIKCAKRMLEEQFFSTTKTVDSELEFKISDLMETKEKYRNLINSAHVLLTNMRQASNAQKVFSDMLNEFSQKNQPLNEPFFINAETQKICYKNSNKIEEVLIMFIRNLTTLSEKTMEDAILNVKQYDMARLEYDTYRNDLEKLKQLPNVNENRLKDAEIRYQEQLLKFEKIKADLNTKLKLLEENKLKVLHRNLGALFEAYMNATSSNHEFVNQLSSKYNCNNPIENSFLNE